MNEKGGYVLSGNNTKGQFATLIAIRPHLRSCISAHLHIKLYLCLSYWLFNCDGAIIEFVAHI